MRYSATGFERTGRLFACERYNLKPDIPCLTKAITGGMAPLGATLTSEEIGRKINKEAGFYSTYGWYPLAVAAATANVEYLIKNCRDIERNTSEMGEFIIDRLRNLSFKHEPTIRGKGLALGIDFESRSYGKQIKSKAFEKGFLLFE